MFRRAYGRDQVARLIKGTRMTWLPLSTGALAATSPSDLIKVEPAITNSAVNGGADDARCWQWSNYDSFDHNYYLESTSSNLFLFTQRAGIKTVSNRRTATSKSQRKRKQILRSKRRSRPTHNTKKKMKKSGGLSQKTTENKIGLRGRRSPGKLKAKRSTSMKKKNSTKKKRISTGVKGKKKPVAAPMAKRRNRPADRKAIRRPAATKKRKILAKRSPKKKISSPTLAIWSKPTSSVIGKSIHTFIRPSSFSASTASPASSAESSYKKILDDDGDDSQVINRKEGKIRPVNEIGSGEVASSKGHRRDVSGRTPYQRFVKENWRNYRWLFHKYNLSHPATVAMVKLPYQRRKRKSSGTGGEVGIPRKYLNGERLVVYKLITIARLWKMKNRGNNSPTTDDGSVL